MRNIDITRSMVIALSLLVLGIANINTFADYWKGAGHALIREMRQVAKQDSKRYQENQDAVVLKHIPIGTSAEMALEICQQNGFETGMRAALRSGEIFPDYDEVIQCRKLEMRWYLFFSDEYLVFAYLKHKRVGAVSGRAFARLFGSI